TTLLGLRTYAGTPFPRLSLLPHRIGEFAMRKRHKIHVLASAVLLAGTFTLAPETAFGQAKESPTTETQNSAASEKVKPESAANEKPAFELKSDKKFKKPVSIAAPNSAELKAAISRAVEQGQIDIADAKELIDKITDIETLMNQFDFI